MIHTSRQLKALVRNRSGGNSAKAQALIRIYAMERFLERVSLSQYKDRLILKGGVLVSSIVGLASRTTLDIDSSVKDLPLTPDDILCVVDAIVSVPLEDGMSFAVKSVRVVEARGTDDVVEGEGTTRGLQGLLYDVHARLIAVVSHPALYGYSC